MEIIKETSLETLHREDKAREELQAIRNDDSKAKSARGTDLLKRIEHIEEILGIE